MMHGPIGACCIPVGHGTGLADLKRINTHLAASLKGTDPGASVPLEPAPALYGQSLPMEPPALPRKTNYDFERRERERNKEAESARKAKAKADKKASDRASPDMPETGDA